MSREGKGISMPQRKACGLQWALSGKCRAVTWAAGRLGEQHMGTPHGNASQRSSQWITKFKPWGLIGEENRFGFRKKKNENWVKTKGSVLFGHEVSLENKMVKAPMWSLVALLERANFQEKNSVILNFLDQRVIHEYILSSKECSGIQTQPRM